MILWRDDVSKVIGVIEDATLPSHCKCRTLLEVENGWPTARWRRVGYYRSDAQLRVADSDAEAKQWAEQLKRGEHFMPTAKSIAHHANPNATEAA